MQEPQNRLSHIIADWRLSLAARLVPSERKALTTQDIRALILHANSNSGQSVNVRSALGVPAVLACVRVIAEGLAQVPWKLFRTTANGGREEARDHPLWVLINAAPNSWQSSFEFRETLLTHAVLCGNGFTVVQRDEMGAVQELLPFEPGLVEVKQATDWSLSYRVRGVNGAAFDVAESDMWHFRGLSWNSYAGLVPLELARNAIGLALATEEFGASFFANGARPSGILSPESGFTFKEEQAAAIKESWIAAHGSGQKQGVAFLNGIKYQSISTNPDDAQFTQTRKAQVEEICRAMRVLPIMVMQTEGTSSYASVEQLLLAHLTHTLAPWMRRFIQSAELKLLTAAERRAGYHMELDDKGLLKGAAKDRAEYHALALQHGWTSRNEVRRLEGLPPLDGAHFDAPHMAENIYGRGQRAMTQGEA